jgi:hypothetical protein
MTETMLQAVLDKAGFEKDDGGEQKLPEGRTLTLYLAHSGTQLQVSRIVALTISGEIVETQDAKGETFLVSREDLFAASVAGETKDGGGTRKAGFLG